MSTTKADRDRNEAIRAYGAAHGWDLSERGPIPAALRADYANAAAGAGPLAPPDPVVFGVPVLDDELLEASPGEVSPDHPGGAGHDEPTGEQPPEPPRKPVAERAREIFGRKDAKPKRRRAAVKPRLSLETLAGAAWSGLTAVIARLGGERFGPVASVMAFEEPVAGQILDEAINGTVIDKPAQVIARFMESGTDAALLLGPPVIVGGVCAGLVPYPVGRAMLGQMLKSWVVMAGPRMRAIAEREARFAEEMAQMQMTGPGGEPVPVTIEDIIDTIFAGYAQGEEMASAAAANGHPGPPG